MKRIAVVDDEKAQTQLLSHLVHKWAGLRGQVIDVQVFDSAEAFSFAWIQNRTFDVLLLDIQMKGQNGVDLAREIRAASDRLPIVFITGVADHMAEGYDVEALHYLLKPVIEEKLFACLDRACQKREDEPSAILETEEGNARVMLKDILYIEAFAHTTAVATVRGAHTVHSGIGELERRLGKGFVRCHRSYLVSLPHIARIGRTELALDDGSTIPVSRRMAADVNRAFLVYHRKEDA